LRELEGSSDTAQLDVLVPGVADYMTEEMAAVQGVKDTCCPCNKNQALGIFKIRKRV
jgi:hypothetical protein